jgi:uncharacterized protein
MNALGHALSLTGSMTWEILWALILGFLLSALVQAVVRRATVVRLLGDDHPRTLAIAAGFGIASSSCSYAAVALARSLFRKGADFTAAMAFEIASTNLVIELGVILALLMGWQFTLAEFIGGPIIIVVVAILFRIVLRDKLLHDAAEQTEKGLSGSMEGHAAMDMAVTAAGNFWQRLATAQGLTAVAHVFVMEWSAIWKDLVAGLLIAGAIGAWVPNAFWQSLFLDGHPLLSVFWGPVIGPLVAVVSFVCSIGNVPLAVVLWSGGISFGATWSTRATIRPALPVLHRADGGLGGCSDIRGRARIRVHVRSAGADWGRVLPRTRSRAASLVARQTKAPAVGSIVVGVRHLSRTAGCIRRGSGSAAGPAGWSADQSSAALHSASPGSFLGHRQAQ